MATREVLTQTQREYFYKLSDQLSERERIRYYTLSEEDIQIIRGCCKTKINMQCYESEKLAEHAIDSDFDHTNVAVPALYL
ncbi:DUF4158 domain-containing protein [Bacillus toyonensis]|uniref:DUF4158 domain-containing protein n=1 Tax=Bacillus toyonensis TaxID=155322 RepID=UPI000BF86C49|nr:hypothetical protein COM39_25720 [Bacillus toyonensis]